MRTNCPRRHAGKRAYRKQFFWQTGVVGLLATAGTIVLSGEPAPDTNLIACVAAQIGIALGLWGTAWLLAKRWQWDKKIRKMCYR